MSTRILINPLTQAYQNFDLLLDPTADGYQARVIASPVGEASTFFRLDNIRIDPSDPKAFGGLLYRAVFADRVGTLLQRSLDVIAQQANQGLRIRLRLSAVPELATLPWETLFDAEHNRFLALSPHTLLVRYPELDQAAAPLQADLPLRMLVLISNPVDLRPLDVEQEWSQLQKSLANLVSSGKVQIERLPARFDELRRYLRSSKPHILHFIGHGWYADATQNGLFLEDENHQSQAVTAEILATVLKTQPALRFVFLNACEGAHGDHANPFVGVAQQLVQQGIPAVIAMQAAVSDQAAIQLAHEFYQAVADGYPIDAALSAARLALYASESSNSNVLCGEWEVPALFSRTADNQLFDLLDVLPAPRCPYPGMVPFRQDDARFFFGRSEEIDELRRRLRHQKQLFVIGPSGSGKSSLVFAGLLPALEKQQSERWRIRSFRPGATPLHVLEQTLLDDQPSPDPADKLLLVVDQFEEIFVQASKTDQELFITQLKELRQNPQRALLVTMRADFYPDLMNSSLWPIDPSQRLEIAPLRGEQLRQAIEQPAANVGVQLEAGLVERLLADAADEPGVLPLLQETMAQLWEEQSRRILPLVAYTRLSKEGRSGLAIAMATKADATWASLTTAQQAIARRIFLRLVQFGEGRADTRRQQALNDLAGMSDDADLFDSTLRTLIDNRLLTVHGEANDPKRKVDIAHEMLIAHWPTAHQWVSERREAELTRRRLEEKAAEWIRLGRGTGGLLDAIQVEEAGRWLQDQDALELGYSEQFDDLVRASRLMVDAVITEKEATRQHELEQAQQLAFEQTKRANAESRRTQTFQRWVTIAAILLVIAIIAAVWGFKSSGNAQKSEATAIAALETSDANLIQKEKERNRANQEAAAAMTSEAIAETERNEAQHQEHIARSRQLAGLAVGLPAQQVDLALLLSLEAYAIEPTGEALSAIFTRLQQNPYLHQYLWLKDGGKYKTASFNQDGSLLAMGTHIFDLSSKWVPTSIELPVVANLVAFSPSEKLLATADLENQVSLLDVSYLNSISKIGKFASLPDDQITGLSFSPNGKLLILSMADSKTLILNVENPKNPKVIDIGMNYSRLAFNHDGRLLAVSSNKLVQLWDMSNLILPTHLDVELPGDSVAFNPNSDLLATSDEGGVYLWDITNPRSPSLITNSLQFQDTGNVELSLAFSNSNVLFGWYLEGGLIYSWDVTNPHISKLMTSELSGYRLTIGSNNKIAWISGDGAAFMAESNLMLGDTHKDDAISLAKYVGLTYYLEFSPKGELLLSIGGVDQRDILWDTSSKFPELESTFALDSKQEKTTQENSPSGSLQALIFPRNNGQYTDQLELWDISNTISPTLLADLPFQTSFAFNEIWDVAFSPNGKLLVAGIGGGKVGLEGELKLWDISDPTTPVLVGTLQNSLGAVTHVSFSQDGKKVISQVWGESSTYAWDVDVVSWKMRACRIANRNLSKGEWKQYMGDVQYHKTCPNNAD